MSKRLSPEDIKHGTHLGYTQHRRLGEEACQDCKDGHAAQVARYRRRGDGVVVSIDKTARCGTESAYQRHVRRGEITDAACRNAHNVAMRRYRVDGTTIGS